MVVSAPKVDADDPLPDRTVEEALRVLIEQMVANSEDVAVNTVKNVLAGGGKCASTPVETRLCRSAAMSA